MTVLLVALGAAVGAPVRYVAAQLFDARLPWGTIAVNVLGSFLLGLLTGLAVDGPAIALLGVGFCGAVTTYSGLAAQVWERPALPGLVTTLLTLAPAVALCAVGFVIGSAL